MRSISIRRIDNGWKLSGEIQLWKIWAKEQGTVSEIGAWAERTLQLQGFLKNPTLEEDEEMEHVEMDDIINLCEEHNLWPFAWNPRIPIGFTNRSDPRMLEEERDVILWMVSNLSQLKYAPWLPTLCKSDDLNSGFFNKCLIGELETYGAPALYPLKTQTVPHYETHLWGERAPGAKEFGDPKIWYQAEYNEPWSFQDYESSSAPSEVHDIFNPPTKKCQIDGNRVVNIIVEVPKPIASPCKHYRSRKTWMGWDCTAVQCRYPIVDPRSPSGQETPPEKCDCRFLPRGIRKNYAAHESFCCFDSENVNFAL